MKKLFLVAAMLVFPLSAGAEHMDVIQVKLNDDCSVEQYVQIKDDFNRQFGKAHGYMAEVAVPIQNDDLVSLFWLGHSESAAAFGATWDAWRDALADPKSVPSKLWARFLKCGTNQSRSGFDLY